MSARDATSARACLARAPAAPRASSTARPAIAWLMVAAMACSRLDPPIAAANPVPDPIAKDFNRLPREIVLSDRSEDRHAFESLLGHYGLDLLHPDTLRFISDHFEVLKPCLITSQAPGYAPSFELQRFFRERALPSDREAMCRTLRHWLTDSIAQAPPTGGMQVTGPPERVAQHVLDTRVGVAEMLSEWRDGTSKPLIGALLEDPRCRLLSRWGWRGDFTMSAGWYLERALRRIEDPCSAGLLEPDTAGHVRICRRPTDVDSIEIYARLRPPAVLTRDSDWVEIARYCEDLARSRLGPDSRGASQDFRVRFFLHDGMRAELKSDGMGRLAYTENTRCDGRWKLTLQNPDLIARILRRVTDE